MGKNVQPKSLVLSASLGVAILLLGTVLSLARAADFSLLAAPNRLQKQADSIAANEAAAVSYLKVIQAAEATFQATQGSGRFAGLQELAGTNLIEPTLPAIGRQGYWFQLKMTASRRSFVAVARPIKSGETGRRSFSINERGILRFSSQPRATVAKMRPLLDTGGGIAANEAFALAMLRTIYSAEAIYQSTAGNGNFGSLSALTAEGIVTAVPARGRRNGYLIKLLRIEKGTPESRPAFEAIATPIRYGETGLRSFYLDESGVIRAADRQGLAANAQDNPID